MDTQRVGKLRTTSLKQRCVLPLVISALAADSLIVFPASAQTAPSATLAQVPPRSSAPPQFIPTDVTPFTVSPERNAFTPGYKFRLFQSLPARLWFNSTTEVSQRLDTNVFFTHGHRKADYAFRVLPNVSVGYNVLKNTAVYANYFVIKDVFARHTSLNFPTTQSLGWGVRQTMQAGPKTNLQFDFQARELWQTSHLHQFDFLPSATAVHMLTPHNVVYGSVLLQLRGRNYFVSPTREIDPFYTVGYLGRRGLWSLIVSDTLVTNFRSPPFHHSVPHQSNISMITDVEINRPVARKFPSLLMFVRAEPIFNWASHKAPGLSGFDFRLYGGLRLSLNKPAYYGSMEKLRQQILESENSDSGVHNDQADNNQNGKAGS